MELGMTSFANNSVFFSVISRERLPTWTMLWMKPGCTGR